MSGMTPRMRNADENTVVCSTTTSRTSSASRTRRTQVIGATSGSASPWGIPANDFDVRQFAESDERPHQYALLEIAAALFDFGHLAHRDAGRVDAVLLARRVDELAFRNCGIRIDEIEAGETVVAAAFQDAGGATVLELDPDARVRIFQQEHRRAV